ncbi:restriction endonuclease subunit S [Lamprobacter modestohalophilus]|uniref:restriction endonuclease subunit S n=1 Tax=Lamprobacter modestohalophilus TaxID=1064514 RepID=UPI002ADEFBD3|nr:restriction endonuclease subunit S [Lamprobacter modestohalophilus]MEA1049539.1 restriction endonuclease subunit S [Lamprobacter modestohalophilus]
MNWSLVNMEEMIDTGLIRLGRGKVISKKDINACPGQYPIYSSARLNDGKFGEYGNYMFDEELITWSVDGGGSFFYRPKHRFSVTNVGGTLRVLDRNKVHYKYLYYVLSYKHSRLLFDWTSKAHPSVIRRLYTEIPLPPLAEQKRIAAILDAADALRAKRRESLAELDRLLQSTFLDLFGDPVTNPKGWDRRTLGEITTIEAAMVDPRKEAYSQLLHYGPDRIEKDTGELLPAKTAEEDELISGKFLCSPGEILYSKIRPYLNKVALVKQPCLCSADVYPVRPNTEVLTKEYLLMLLRSAGFLDYVAGFSRRANIPKLNRKQFAGYNAPTPPINLQNHFATIVESIERQKTRLRAHLAELDTLFASLQSRAFNGEL